MEKITPADLVAMDDFASSEPLRIDLAYATPYNLLFGERIYRPDARLWLHGQLAKIVIEAARHCFEKHGLRFVLFDGLRTTNAQQKMLETERVKQNPHWLQEPRLLSPPGTGGHPRGMAIDIALEDGNGELLDMGTEFDFLAPDPSPEKNPAHREYKGHAPEVYKNRGLLTDAMMSAAAELEMPLLPLPQEWWDYRLPASIYDRFAPLSDEELPPEMRMVLG